MPKPVKSVPNAWLPYMDGQIWEFTHDEWKAMSPPFSPMQNIMGEYCGVQYIVWAQKDHMYVRFYRRQDIAIDHPNDYPEWLAGWIGEQSDTPSKEWYEAHWPDKFDVG